MTTLKVFKNVFSRDTFSQRSCNAGILQHFLQERLEEVMEMWQHWQHCLGEERGSERERTNTATCLPISLSLTPIPLSTCGTPHPDPDLTAPLGEPNRAMNWTFFFACRRRQSVHSSTINGSDRV